MTFSRLIAPRRVRYSCAKLAPIRRIWSLMSRQLHRRKGKHVKQLSDHLARDIGLNPAQMERHRFVWPSESANRPKI
jgi:uncharacterized protein YjiS (DUF1127 family)